VNSPTSSAPERAPVLVLVGPGRHFGCELIQRFRMEGFLVGVIASTAKSLSLLTEQLGHDAGVRFARADVTEKANFDRVLAELADALGGVDCLIYNPKVSVKGSGLTTPPDELAFSLQVNVVGAVVAIQAALPYLSRSTRPTVILTGGGYKDDADVEKFALSVGKSALHAVARTLQKPLRQRGVQLKTIIVRKVVRASDPRWTTARDLADYFWNVFAYGRATVFYYPLRGGTSADQLSLLAGRLGSSE